MPLNYCSQKGYLQQSMQKMATLPKKQSHIALLREIKQNGMFSLSSNITLFHKDSWSILENCQSWQIKLGYKNALV